jgi:Ca-activated chloride channel family protein
MKRSTRVTLVAGVALCLLLLAGQPALADGIIIIDPPVEPDVPSYLTVKYHRVTVTIEDQVATTHVDQVFVNESRRQVEGTYVFPLPDGAAINDFAMWVDGERLPGEILAADEARRIYEDIVRCQRDPALLEYVGRSIFRARIFPIPPNSEKRVEIEYSEVLPLDNGLMHYRYPLDTERFSAKPVGEVSIHVAIHSQGAIKAVYSPSHEVDVDRQGDFNVAVGYEAANVLPDTDFHLYTAVAQEDVGLNLLSYPGRGGEDGFFLMLLAPRVEVDRSAVVAKDVVLVLDTSGSMRGEKLVQAKKALSFVLNRLNDEDRFNVVTFSTAVHSFAGGLTDVSERESARSWVEALEAKGGTNSNRAMLEALAQAAAEQGDTERPAIVIFLTDGLATEGVVETEQILRNVDDAAPGSARIFTFGVGDEVNTVLLDRMARDHRGASAYVRPGQGIDEEVSAFYAKVSTPLLSDVQVDLGVQVEDTYPYPLPDLFAGTQVIMVGRYRGGGETTVVLKGTVNGREETLTFPGVQFASDQQENQAYAFIPRLWATRKVGYLLNEIRLHGESRELVEEIVDLSVRYGIMTPYTSFLVNEDAEVFSERGRALQVDKEYLGLVASPPAAGGKEAVDEAEQKMALEGANTATGATGTDLEPAAVKIVGTKAFVQRDGVWIDTTYDAERMTPLKVGFMSDDYFRLVAARPEWGAYLAVGERVLVVLPGADGQETAYLVVDPDDGQAIEIPPIQAPRETPVAHVTPSPGATATPAPSDPHDPLAGPRESASLLCRGSTAVAVLSLLAGVVFVRRQ